LSKIDISADFIFNPSIMETYPSPTHVMKQFFSYLIMLVCILFIAIGIFTFLRVNLIKYVFTEVDNFSFTSQCNYIPVEKTNETLEACTKRVNAEAAQNKIRSYQDGMLSSILMLVVASGVLVVNDRYISKR
jgi:hypothetical protein